MKKIIVMFCVMAVSIFAGAQDLKPTEESILFKFKVMDYDGFAEIGAGIRIHNDAEEFKCVSDTFGYCQMLLNKGIKYKLEVSHLDTLFTFNNKIITVPNQAGLFVMDYDLKIKYVELGYSQTFTLDVYFKSGEFNLDMEDMINLEGLLEQMKTNDNMKIEIAAHTDNVGHDASNLALSQKRASSVVDYLSKKGIPSGRMVAKGYGEEKPIAENETPEGRAKNRRVEVRIITI